MENNLLDILRFKRKHGSITELMFIEDYLLPRLHEYCDSVEADGGGNIWATVGERKNTLFVSHIDTCHNNEGTQELHITITESGSKHVSLPDSQKYNKETKKGSTCLGADDAVGMYINLELAKNGVNGTYLFTRGEERGLIGASWIVDNTPDKLRGFKRSIEVDRNYFDEIIVEQASGKCASHIFANQLAKKLGMGHSPSELGMYTDNSAFNEFIPENVNIAAGYWSQHTVKETVDVSYVDDLLAAMLKVDWDSLDVHRDTSDLGSSMDAYYQRFLDGSYHSAHDPDYGAPANTPMGREPALSVDSSFEQYLEYVRGNTSIVAWFLYLNGVDEYEIVTTWDKGTFEEDF